MMFARLAIAVPLFLAAHSSTLTEGCGGKSNEKEPDTNTDDNGSDPKKTGGDESKSNDYTADAVKAKVEAVFGDELGKMISGVPVSARTVLGHTLDQLPENVKKDLQKHCTAKLARVPVEVQTESAKVISNGVTRIFQVFDQTEAAEISTLLLPADLLKVLFSDAAFVDSWGAGSDRMLNEINGYFQRTVRVVVGNAVRAKKGTEMKGPADVGFHPNDDAQAIIEAFAEKKVISKGLKEAGFQGESLLQKVDEYENNLAKHAGNASLAKLLQQLWPFIVPTDSRNAFLHQRSM